jgi:DNA (cytosine-5)-methyltransferase 1
VRSIIAQNLGLGQIGLGVSLKPTAIDLFAGAGGCTLGLRNAGFEVRVAVDIDPHKAQTLAVNNPSTRVLGLVGNDGDVKKLKSGTLRRVAGIANDQLDILVACPPCQGFSLQGNRNPDDHRNTLYLEFLRLTRQLGPATIAFENVPGLLSSEEGQIIDEITAELERIGYATSTWILDAHDFGVPQARKRLFLVGALHRAAPRPPRSVETRCAVWEAIADLPIRNPSEKDGGETILVPYRGLPRSRYARVLRGRRSKVANCEATNHDPVLRERLRSLRWGERDPATWHRRLHPNRPSPTLTAGTRTRTACRPIHPFASRVLTVREAARLSSFPDWYLFPAQKAEAWSQIGNAVPPRMAEIVFERLRSRLDGSTASA